MPAFNPYPGMVLRIGSIKYELLAHQVLPDNKPDVFVVEGEEAFVYKMQSVSEHTLWALKVMKPRYRSEQIALATAQVSRYQDTPGLYLGRRICLTKREHLELVLQFPDLEYAILMPWLSWHTWAGLMHAAEASAYYTRIQAVDLALATAHILWGLETHGFAHTDVAGGNVACMSNFQHVELLDIESLYIPHAPRPRQECHGSPGYQHRIRRGQWCPEGDRFAGAILLTEMLTWWNPFVRAQTPQSAESLFLPEELQETGSPRWQTVRDVLWSFGPDVLHLFDQAWASRNLRQCPDFSTWTSCLKRIRASGMNPAH